MNVETLTPAELIAAAKKIAKQAKSELAHWSTAAAILRRVEQEGLYADTEPPYAHASFFAEEVMGLSLPEYIELASLGDLMAENAVIPAVEWLPLSKSKAVLVKKARDLQGDVVQWLLKAQQAKTVEALRLELDKLAGKDLWVTFRIRLPESTAALTKQAMLVAMPEGTDPAVLEHPSQAHKAWEAIVTAYVAQQAFKEGLGSDSEAAGETATSP